VPSSARRTESAPHRRLKGLPDYTASSAEFGMAQSTSMSAFPEG
jgi:hypothetical protein